jgi:hypothetical protein
MKLLRINSEWPLLITCIIPLDGHKIGKIYEGIGRNLLLFLRKFPPFGAGHPC